MVVKCWDSNSTGDEGGYQGRMGVNFDGFLRHRTRGASTPDLIVTEFWIGCGQTDLASAYVLCPLNHLVLDFKDKRGDGMNEQRFGVYRTRVEEGFTARGGVKRMSN